MNNESKPTTAPEPSNAKYLWYGLGILIALFSVLVFLEFFWSQEIKLFMNYVADQFGFLGLVIALFISDWVVSPLPPDLVLIIIAKSHFRENFPFYVTVISLTSLLAGQVGWACGRYLMHFFWVPQWIKTWATQHHDSVSKYGFWGVVLGALTPLPYSITCWSAGFLGLEYRKMALASLVRVPRVWIVYLVIHFSNNVASWF